MESQTLAMLNHLQRAIDDVERLIGLARKVQEDSTRGDQHLQELQSAYYEWEARARVLLPTDMIAVFDAEFNPGQYGPWKIKKYFEYALESSNIDMTYVHPDHRHLHSRWQAPAAECFAKPAVEQKKILLAVKAREELKSSVRDETDRGVAGMLSSTPTGEFSTTIRDVLDLYASIFARLPRVLNVLARPARNGRSTLEIEDEYDLQRVIHAVLVSLSDDVRAEELSPSVLGAGSRIDFLVKDRKLAVEVKYVRAKSKGRDLGAEVAEDVKRYSAHPDVAGLLFIVHDPCNLLGNPRGLEADAHEDSPSMPVRLKVVH